MTNPTDNPLDDRGAGPDAGSPAAEALEAELVEEAPADSGDAASPDGSGDAASDELSHLRGELDERTDDLKRVTAEYANFRRRVDRDRQLDRELAKASIAGEMLGLADDLDRAEQHGDLSEGPLKTFADKFRATLTGLKITSFGEEGDEFDPAIHEAVQDSSTGDDKVLGAVLRKGYRLDERLIRTAMVVIADPA